MADNSSIDSASPMVRSYRTAQEAAPGYLILYRVGEFYEVLFQAAAVVSRGLGIQLTRRRQKDADDIPMCGIPAGSAEAAVGRLLAAGHKIALSEQPLEAGGERPLRRLTPSTTVDPAVLDGSRPNNLTVAHAEGQQVGFAWIDLSTGEAGASVASLTGCAAALARVAAAEVLVSRWPEASDALAVAVRGSGVSFSDLPEAWRPSDVAGPLLEAYGPAAAEALRGFSPPERTALAALLAYVRGTVGGLPTNLQPPRRVAEGDIMEIDAPTLRGLEVLTSGAGRDGSLLSAIDRTVTAPGARLLVRQLSAPLTDPETIGRRLAMVRFLLAQPQVRTECRETLSGLPDMLRACGRLSLGQGGPRDLAAVRLGLEKTGRLAAILETAPDRPLGLVMVGRDLGTGADEIGRKVLKDLHRALVPQPPPSIEEGAFVAEGFSRRLDDARSAIGRTKEAIDQLQARYATETGVKTLKIRANTAIGYHVEVPASAAKALGEGFSLRQGLASTTRFSTPELDRLAGDLEGAGRQVAAAAQAIFNELSSAVLASRKGLTRMAHAAAALDLVAGLAQAAAEGLWVEPELAKGVMLEIEQGRHPVAERLLEGEGKAFEPNDCRMTEVERLWLLTGPNMAGKSTFLRQVALIVLMAQVGSFVPARRARIGIVDKMFSRIGSGDDLAAGRSTFMVEMLETAAILNQATERSLVILDEVGRGTSTHDGLAIAEASMEHLHDVIGCRALFATHFHELAHAAERMERAVCMAMDATPGRHDAVFTYRVVPGRAGQSFGLRVAERAGMPASVLERAAQLLRDPQKPAPD
jgi:DNA mismatch repair protein MutS